MTENPPASAACTTTFGPNVCDRPAGHDGRHHAPNKQYFDTDLSDASLALGPGNFWCPDHPWLVFGMKGTGYGPPCPTCGWATTYQGSRQPRGQVNTLSIGGGYR